MIGGRGDRIGGGDDGAEHERGRPRQSRDDLVSDDGDDDHRQEHEADREPTEHQQDRIRDP